MIALLIALTLAAVWLLADITLTLRRDRPVMGVRSHRPANTRAQLRARPFRARTEHLVARTGCLLRRREPLLSAWPVPELPAHAMRSTVPIGHRPLRQLEGVSA